MQLLPALESGGVERSTLEIAAALVAAGHRSIVVSAGGRLQAALEAGGSEHVRLDIGRKSLLTLRHVRTLRRLFGDLAPDIVHARSRLPAWLAWLAVHGMRGRRPHFLTTVHGLNSPSRYSRIMARGERVICVSRTVREYLLRHYPDTDPARLCVIPRGIDPAEFPRGFTPEAEWLARLRAEFPQLQGGRLLLLPARGTRLKGHAEAIALLAALRGAGIDARLWLLGAREAGRERYLDQLRAQARRLGVDDALAIDAPRSDIREAYAVSDLVLQLSAKPEAFGRTVVEALASGRPVLGWAHGGVGELLGELYPAGAVAPGDAAALHARARTLLAAPPSPPAAIPYTLAAMQRATLELYERLAG
ncbi:glycosyltransferase involved in cell wall biosynthesis [Rehaibacterium terrae]|jgi:glycosyltransferase involved in cell wall biosynthesis|uniref:Glycosyltransferase involved in cell wall biosynthesis n=2 Tax=Rehaibacterium terrae TaxID=1341696 RepID=A0A7W7XYK8_9GAMM|nr:glycosyltransferase [Rehaibacterium terrae]MBB5014818.1 glycosyltransferase involved in cell wall biosynthesis [Rehaibacterium terrae]